MKFTIAKIFDIKTVKQYLIQIFFMGVMLNIVLCYSFLQIADQYATNSSTLIQRTISEYGDLNFDYICKITNCISIKSELSGYNNYTYVKNEFGQLVKTKGYVGSLLMFNSSQYQVTDNFNIVYKEPIYKIVLESDTSEMVLKTVKTYIIINILFVLIYSFLYFNSKYKEKKRHLLEIMGTEGSLREKNMKILTENVHHELNTPVAIIQGTIRKLEIELLNGRRAEMECPKAIQGACKTYNTTDFDFQQIYSSIDSVNTVLRRMSNFKQIKYSNGNKTVNDICRYSANSMNIYKKSNFNIEMNENLNNYNLKGDLTNGDLLNIISNHLRNSLEANSTKIIIDCAFKPNRKDESVGKLHIFIIDNGTGIRDGKTGLPLAKGKLDDVFKPYYSTKDNSGNFKIENEANLLNRFMIKLRSIFEESHDNYEIRGVGLFLNKQMLIESGGELVLRETSDKGTVFEIIVNAKETDTLISQKKLLKELL